MDVRVGAVSTENNTKSILVEVEVEIGTISAYFI